MSKKDWKNPEVKELSIKSTEYGKVITQTVDAVFQDGDDTFFSFS